MEEQMQVQEIFTVLHKWGIHTLGQLAALDKEDLRNRLGSEAVRLWERANGTATRLLKFVRPPESFEESFEFENEIETAEPLLFMLRRFLEQLAVRLNAIYSVAKELTLSITFANKESYQRVFKIPQPTNDAAPDAPGEFSIRASNCRCCADCAADPAGFSTVRIISNGFKKSAPTL